MKRAYKFRLYPTRQQSDALSQMLETHRHLYNAALEQRQWAYKRTKKSPSYFTQTLDFKDAFYSDPFLQETNYSSCLRTLRRLDKAVQGFFRRVKASRRAGYPRFKGRGRFDTIEFVAGDGSKLLEKRTYVQHVGNIKTKVHRAIEGKPKTISVKRETGCWYVILVCDIVDSPIAPKTGPAVGIDLGLTAFIATSSGEQIAAPRFSRAGAKELRRVQRALSRKKRGSRRRTKARLRVARLHQHIANQRRDWHHKVALDLIRSSGTTVHEKLNIVGIARTRLAKSTLDAGWGQFLRILSSKAAEAGCTVIAVNPRNTSQVCSDCGALPTVALTLKDRVYTCEHCGFTSNRDVNAAKNILRLGSSRQALTPSLDEVA